MRAGRVARDDAHLSPAESGLATIELLFELGGFEVETAGTVSGCVATGVDATSLKDLRGHLLKTGWARRARTHLGCALPIAASTDERHCQERSQRA